MDRKFLGGRGTQDEKSWKFQGYGEYHESPGIENPRRQGLNWKNMGRYGYFLESDKVDHDSLTHKKLSLQNLSRTMFTVNQVIIPSQSLKKTSIPAHPSDKQLSNFTCPGQVLTLLACALVHWKSVNTQLLAWQEIYFSRMKLAHLIHCSSASISINEYIIKFTGIEN